MTNLRVTAGSFSRDFDARLGGSVLNCIPLRGKPAVRGPLILEGELLAACDAGAWLFGDTTQAKETTQELVLADGSVRDKYRLRTVRVRRETHVGVEKFKSDDTATTLEDADFSKVIHFGGRAIRRVGDRLFYATAVGLFESAVANISWHACATPGAKVTDSQTDPTDYFAEGRAGAPMGVNDLVCLGPDAANDGFLVATDTGLFILKIGAEYRWTALPLLSATCVHRVIQLSSATAGDVLMCTEGGIYRANFAGKRRPSSLDALVIRSGQAFIDLRSEVGPVRQVHLESSSGHLLIIGTSMMMIQPRGNDGSYELVAHENPIELSKLDGGAESRFGERAVFLHDGSILYAGGDKLVLFDGVTLAVEASIATDAGVDLFRDQPIISVGEVWPGVIAIGTSQGGLQLLGLDAIRAALTAKEARLQVLDRTVWSRSAPLQIDKIIVPGPTVPCSHGEYIKDNNDPPCAQSDEQEQSMKQFIIDLGVAALATATTIFSAGGGAAIAAGIALNYFTDAMKQLLINGGVHDAFSAWVAKMFYGYDGHANCVMVPSGPIMAGDKIIEFYPRAFEGSFSGDGNYSSSPLSAFGKNASCGYARFDGSDGGTNINNFDLNGQDVFSIIFVHFKNWSDDRMRTAKLDVLVQRNQLAERSTVIIP